MPLQDWLGETAVSQFVAEYYCKLPHSGTCADRCDCELGQWNVLEKVVSAQDADVMVVRKGRRFEGDWSSETLRELVEQGCTILVRHAERHDEQLQRLADDFRRVFHAPVNIHMYATPAGHFGFDWHYDVEEVFILQTTGQKEYSLRKNTVNPWPLPGGMPADLKYERELMPLMRCRLAAGDWLYIPNGYWHKAEAAGEEVAISLAVGVMAPAAMAVLDHLRDQLADSLLWRQRLPVPVGSEVDESFRDVLADLVRQLGEDINRRLKDENLVDALIDELYKRPG